MTALVELGRLFDLEHDQLLHQGLGLEGTPPSPGGTRSGVSRRRAGSTSPGYRTAAGWWGRWLGLLVQAEDQLRDEGLSEVLAEVVEVEYQVDFQVQRSEKFPKLFLMGDTLAADEALPETPAPLASTLGGLGRG